MSAFRRVDVLVITENEELRTAFRRVPGLIGRPVRVLVHPTLTHPAVLDAPTPWAALFLDTALLAREAAEAWTPILRRLHRRYPRMKWVACGPETTRPLGLPRWLRFHRVLPPPWSPEALAHTLKSLLLPHAEVQAALAIPGTLPPRPEWLNHQQVKERLWDLKQRFSLPGLGWYDFQVGPMAWEGELWPQTFRPFPPQPGEKALARYAWWEEDDIAYWFYALPVFEDTWLAAWGRAPFPFRALPEEFAALRDALQHMEAPTTAEPPPDTEFPELKPLFDDVPPPFPEFPL